MRLIFSSAVLMLSTAAVAEEFDYEVSLGFNRANQTTTVELPPDLDRVVSNTDGTESDIYSASLRWYLGGLLDDQGPRDRAAFTNRATFVEFAVLSGTVTRPIGFPPADAPFPTVDTDFDATGYVIAGRKVFNNWFFTGTASASEIDFGAIAREQTVITTGVGRYIGESTALSISAIRVTTDVGSSDDIDSGLEVNFNHVGDVPGAAWQYAVDLSASNESFGDSNGRYRAGLTLYPTKNFGFGIGVDDQLGESNNSAIRYTLGANWFVSPQLQLEFSIGTVDVDDLRGQDTDSDEFSIRALYRF